MRMHERTFKPHDPIQAWLETRSQTERDILTKTPAAFAVDAARIQLLKAKWPGDFIDLGPADEGAMERAEAAALATAEGGLSAFRSGALRAWARGERTPWTLGREVPPGIHPFLPPSFMRETENAPITAILIRGSREGFTVSGVEWRRREFDARGFRGASPEEIKHVLTSAKSLPHHAKIISARWDHSHPGHRGGRPHVAIARSLVNRGTVTALLDPCETYRCPYEEQEDPAADLNRERIDDVWAQLTTDAYFLEIVERVELP